jgi:hypothetical protein
VKLVDLVNLLEHLMNLVSLVNLMNLVDLVNLENLVDLVNLVDHRSARWDGEGAPMRWSPLSFGSTSEWVRGRLSLCRPMLEIFLSVNLFSLR